MQKDDSKHRQTGPAEECWQLEDRHLNANEAVVSKQSGDVLIKRRRNSISRIQNRCGRRISPARKYLIMLMLLDVTQRAGAVPHQECPQKNRKNTQYPGYEDLSALDHYIDTLLYTGKQVIHDTDGDDPRDKKPRCFQKLRQPVKPVGEQCHPVRFSHITKIRRTFKIAGSKAFLDNPAKEFAETDGVEFLDDAAVITELAKFRKTLAKPFAGRFVPCLLLIFLWSSCSEEQLFPGNARLKMTFQLTSKNALGGSIAVQQAYLKLQGISVTGSLGDKNVPEANYPISREDPPYRLTDGDSARVSLTLPSGAYDEMDLHLFLLQTDYRLIVHQKTTSETPPPAEQDNEEPAGDGTNGGGNNSSSDDNDGNNEQPDDQGNGGADDNDASGDDDTIDQDSDDHSDDDADDNESNDNGDDNQKGDGGKKSDKDKGKKNDDKKKKGNDDDDRDESDDRDDDDDDDDDRDDDDGDNERISNTQVNKTVDLDHFFQHAKPALVVFATWTFNGKNVNVVFAVTDVQRITLRATQHQGSQISVDEHGRGTVKFDPERWFESISTSDLENASLQTYQGQPVMFIHKEINPGLFEKLLDNLIATTAFEVATSSDQ